MKYIAIGLGSLIAYKIADNDWLLALGIVAGTWIISMIIVSVFKRESNDAEVVYVVPDGQPPPTSVDISYMQCNDRYLINENPNLRRAIENNRKKLK